MENSKLEQCWKSEQYSAAHNCLVKCFNNERGKSQNSTWSRTEGIEREGLPGGESMFLSKIALCSLTFSLFTPLFINLLTIFFSSDLYSFVPLFPKISSCSLVPQNLWGTLEGEKQSSWSTSAFFKKAMKRACIDTWISNCIASLTSMTMWKLGSKVD